MAEDKLNIRPVDFMKHICQLYLDARSPKFPYENIARGNSRIVSSEVEDLTAAFLSTNLHGEYEFLTDQSMRVEGVRRFVPDVVIMKQNVIHDIIDVKMDLGRRRDDFYTEGGKWEDILQQINGKDCSFIDGVTKERKYASFADSVTCHIIVIVQETSILNNFDNNSLNSMIMNQSMYIVSLKIYIQTHTIKHQKRLLES